MTKLLRQFDEEKWKAIQAKCVCIPRSRRAFIQTHMDIAEDFPDGAFFAYLAENGIDVSELEVFATDHDCGVRR